MPFFLARFEPSHVTRSSDKTYPLVWTHLVNIFRHCKFPQSSQDEGHYILFKSDADYYTCILLFLE